MEYTDTAANPILTERSGDFTTSTATVRDRLKQEMVKHLPAEHLHTDRTRLALDNNSEFVSHDVRNSP